MTREEEKLLLKDLFGRVLYGVKMAITNKSLEPDYPDVLGIEVLIPSLNEEDEVSRFESDGWIVYLDDSKPYLRPMSSMTEEEFESLKQYSGLEYDQLDLAEFPNNHKCLDFYLSEVPSYTVILVFDWLNAHHFDYRGLIPMGLALEAPEGMYKTE